MTGFLMLGGPAALAATNPASGQTTNGQTLNVRIDSPLNGAKTTATSIPVAGKVSLGPLTSTATVAYVVDNSGSTYVGTPNDCNDDDAINSADDLNGDGLNGTVIDCEIAGVAALNTSLASAANTFAGVIGFGSSAAVADVRPVTGMQGFTTPTQAEQGNGRTNVENVLRSFSHRSGGVSVIGKYSEKTFIDGTNFQSAVDLTRQLFGFAPEGTKVAYFLSDGVAARATTQAQQAAAAGIVINTFSVGADATGCGLDDGVPTALQEIANLTGGTCTEVLDPGDLKGELEGQTPAGIEGVSLSLNGGPLQPATLDALGNFSGTVGPLVPGLNIIYAQAEASDGTKVTAAVGIIRQVPTTLVAEPTVAKVLLPPTEVNIGQLKATLTGPGGVPIPGKKITFKGALGTLCTATTDLQGVAKCVNLVTSLQAILSLRYTASFAGDGPFLPSTSQGVLINLLGIKIL